MRALHKAAIFVLTFSSCLLAKNLFAGGLNLPDDSDGGKICKVTSMVDDLQVSGSLRRALETGYNVTDSAFPHFCTEKIVFDAPGTISLHAPIQLNNKAASGFTLEKSAGVRGEVILDASALGAGSCAIVLDSNQVTIRGITIRGAAGSGICLKSGSNGNLIDVVTVTGSTNSGVLVESGSQRNTIQNGFYYDNKEFGVKLGDAAQNKVTHNAIYRNGQGPIDSPATNLKPEIVAAAPANSAASSFTLSGIVPTAVDHVEIYRGALTNSTTNFIMDVTQFSALSFLATVDARAGEDVFAVGIAPDGTTSPSSTIMKLSAVGGGPGNPGGNRPCFPGQVFPPTADFDGDGIYDVNEDKNANCVVDPGETDPANPDTDGDGIPDGIEDRNKNGIVDPGESDPTKDDTDGDFIKDGVEDRNHNGLHESDELDPTKKDTDGDGIPDNLEDRNKNGIVDPSETDGTLPDTDFDGLPDGVEDANHDGVHDSFRESDPRKSDTDGDGLLDAQDACPNNPSLTCKVPCIPGVVPDDTVDNDGDGVPDSFEDHNHDCVVDPGETDPFKKDTDGDSKNDRIDECPNNADLTCKAVCDPENINQWLDSDGDGVPNSVEDKNANCLVDPNESDPFNPDTDGDGITDGNDICPLDPNPLCAHECKPGVPSPPDQDSDGDGIPDANEDINQDCIQSPNETNFRKRDTDGDGINDNNDPCPLNPDPACVKECVPGEFIPPQRDSDRDGIKDVMEDTNKNCLRDIGETDAYNPDTDGDGLPDGIEDRNQNGIFEPGETDPRNPDTDGDGIPDGVEDLNHNGIVDFDELDPKSADTDGDGIPDFIEDANRNGTWDKGETNGARKDTDQDGLLDGVEDANHNGIVDAGETDARNPDSDGDGVTDGQEVAQGTNPIQASTSDFNKAVGKGCSLGLADGAPTDYWFYMGSALIGLYGLRFRSKKK